MSRSKANSSNKKSGLGFEDKLCQAADKFSGNMDSAEFKHVVLVSRN